MTLIISSQQGGLSPVDPTVSKIEAAYVATADGDMSKLSIAQRLPYRPGYGQAGRSIQVYANFFAIETPAKFSLGHYSIGTDEALAKMKTKRREIIILALEKIPEWAEIKNRVATDFSSNLIVVGGIKSIDSSSEKTKIEKDGQPLPTLSISVQDIKEDGTPAEGKGGSPPKVWNIQFRAVKTHHIDKIIAQLSSSTGPHLDDGEKYETMQAMNILLGHYARMSDDVFLKSNGQRNKLWHRQTERYNLGKGIEAIKGFISSVRYSTGRILLNVNNAAIAGYRSISLWESIVEFNGGTGNSESERFIKTVKIHRNWLDKPGQKVRSKDKSIWGFAHRSDGAGVKIDGKDIVQVRQDFASPANVRFLLNGEYVTVAVFWARTYPQLPIKLPDAPVVNIGSKTRPIYAPPEFCFIVDGQDYRSKLAGPQTECMLHFAVSRPNFNLRYIEERSPPVLGLQSSLLKIAGITIKPKLITVKARMLPPPSVNYSNRATAVVRVGGWNMGGLKVIKGAQAIKGWKFIVISTRTKHPNLIKDEAALVAQKFATELTKIGIVGVVAPEVAAEALDDANQTSFDAGLKIMFERHAKSPFLFLVLPSKLPEWEYKRIKYFGDIVYGVHTVCVTGEKLATARNTRNPNNFTQYCANVALKVNLKLGGANQGPDPTKLGAVASKKTMLVGLDVTHPAPGSKGTAQSVAAMVANIDGNLGQWPAALELNGHRKEEVGIIEKMLMSRLDLWKSKGGNADLPKYIMFFRDGVSEGQFQRVLQMELPQIRSAIDKKYGRAAKPLLFVAVCGKRHQVRFGPTQSADQDENSGNCLPGMVVDSGITESRVWDFYLQAHKALKGTAKSCHYTVLYDEIFANKQALAEFSRGSGSGTKADVVQEFCNAMAYTYPRATKAVSLATPAKLADLACDRARAYVSEFIDTEGSDRGSVTAASEASAAARAQEAAIKVHTRLQNTMFYV